MKQLLILLIITINIIAGGFSKMATKKPELIQDAKVKMWCPICGMNLKKFYKTSHAAITKDGQKRQYCSMRCLLVDMKTHQIDKNSIKVVDVISQKLIPAKQAYYVVGSKIKGTMSKISKLAFAKKDDALNFIKKYGGKLMSFEQALNIAKKGLQNDIAMINMKRAKMMYPKGKMIYEKKCKKFSINLEQFQDINQLKAYIINNNLCKIKGKPFQALALYLWDVKRFENNNIQRVQVSKKDKCPVCGMFVYKYPKWAAQMTIKHNNHNHKFSFDGVKDMMKFYFQANNYINMNIIKSDIQQMVVTDYYTLKALNAKDAFYVIHSNVYGPMGNELIPFATLNAAKSFIKDHGGEIIRFHNITLKLVLSLDK